MDHYAFCYEAASEKQQNNRYNFSSVVENPQNIYINIILFLPLFTNSLRHRANSSETLQLFVRVIPIIWKTDGALTYVQHNISNNE